MTEAVASEGQVGLAYEARTVRPRGPSPPSWMGAKQHGSRAATGVPAPTASSTARLGISIKDSTRQPSEQPLAMLVLTFRV